MRQRIPAAAPVLSLRLLSRYKAVRDAEGQLVLMMPWPWRPLLGCAAPVAIVAIAAWLIPKFNQTGFAWMALFFAAVVIPILIYQNSHAWILRRGFIRQATTIGARYWPQSEWLEARSVVLQRELWPSGRGSTDKVLVMTDGNFAMSVASVYNWDGHESRLASGGKGSLARSGPTVPSAPAPLATAADVNLKSSVSEAIREITDVVVVELGVPLAYQSGYARQDPDDTS
jgi:hypothetical protein